MIEAQKRKPLYNFEYTDIIECHSCRKLYAGDGYSRCIYCNAGLVYQCWVERPYSNEQIQKLYNTEVMREATGFFDLLPYADSETLAQVMALFEDFKSAM